MPIISLYHVALFLLALASSSFCYASMNNITNNSDTFDPKVGIQLTDPFPSPYKQMYFRCTSGSFVMGGDAGRIHEWSVPIEQVEPCNVTWGHSAASFEAYNHDIDAGHVLVYWLVKNDGFFHSWDYYNWDKRTGWQH